MKSTAETLYVCFKSKDNMKNIFVGMTGKAEGILRTRGKQVDEEVDKATSEKKPEPKKEQRPPMSKKWTEK